MKTTREYRLVLERPPHQDGRRYRYYDKKDWGHARRGLQDHARDMKRYLDAGLDPWFAWVEEREVTTWEKVELTGEGPRVVTVAGP